MPPIPTPYPRDLFGHVAVTHQDVATWLLCVPRLDPRSPRAAWYVKGYRVIDKIQRAKLDGTFETLKPPPFDGDPGRWYFS
ncbi:hypothetical protein [Rhodoferax sp.]|uniref:hypothetical protein n=1 Tax=Rhodoferax sp. TaxID=50421 RepID=UPI00374CF455